MCTSFREGESTGKKKQLIRMVCKKLAKNETSEVIAEELEAIEVITEIGEAVE